MLCVWYMDHALQSQQSDPDRCYYIPVVDQSGGMLNDLLQMLDQNHYWLSIADSDLILYIKGLAIAGKFDVIVQEPDVARLPSGAKAQIWQIFW